MSRTVRKITGNRRNRRNLDGRRIRWERREAKGSN